MNKTGVIIGREYLHAIKKKSFLIMTILGPILLAALMVTPTLVSMYGKEPTVIAVLDETNIFSKLDSPNDKDISYIYVNANVDDLKNDVINKKYTALLYIRNNSFKFGGMIYSSKTLSTGVISNALSAMKRNLSNEILIRDFNINEDTLNSYIEKQTEQINLGYTHIDEDGKEETKASYDREIQFFAGFIGGFLIYIFIFMYGSMVLRGVLEEKSNRIVEIMVSSVKPVQLMAGKIIGVALIGLTQIALWIILTLVIVTAFQFTAPALFGNDTVNSAEIMQTMPQTINATSLDTSGGGMLSVMANQSQSNEMMQSLLSIDYFQLIILFLFYFMGGYFLYATLYAAVGSAVDNDTDTQQFLLPLTIPFLLTLILAAPVADNPDGQLAFWLSIIPFTSPVSMLVRIPAGSEVVPMWEIFLSISLLVLACAASLWMAAKIYRTGILMYGKKISYKELWKWLRYKN
ncbi:MAG: ABC transporter permease [Bacteroidales bacterium]|jgi:ABC-2 type transport system permease protein|nr:ABC transporter permease [Bacteroidales bacterium]